MKTSWTIAALLALTLAPALAQTPSPAPSAPPLPKNCANVTQPFIGTICTPPGAGKHPAMILLGGSEGGNAMGRLAPLFAAHGYVAASVAYFGMPGLPKTLVDVPVETVGRALTALAKRPDVDGKIGILGGSKGGEFALLAASTYPAIDAVVAIVPSPVAFMGLGPKGYPSGCSWSEDGKPLPCVPASSNGMAALGAEFSKAAPVALKVLYDASLAADPAVTQAAYFPLQRIDGPVLCLAGADDQLWDSPKQCAMTMQYLKDHQHAYADRAIVYPNAGHTFAFAFTQAGAITSVHEGPISLALGGTVKGNMAGSASAWPTIWTFLAHALTTPPAATP